MAGITDEGDANGAAPAASENGADTAGTAAESAQSADADAEADTGGVETS
jgi:hypothetical protein